MTSFPGNPSDLADAIAYEVQAIDYLRTVLHGHCEAPGDGMSIVLGDVNEEGVQRRQVYVSATIGSSERAVRTALNRLRPLAFSAAFKIQDMVAEWILRANGVTAWPFSMKLAAYDRLRASGALIEPDLLAGDPVMARAFWELYRAFEPFRGAIVHSGGVTLESDGTLVVVSRRATTLTLTLTPAEQASYMRAMCVGSAVLSGRVAADPFLKDLIESDLVRLQKHHAQAGLVVRVARLEVLSVRVPRSRIERESPLSVTVDFDDLRRTMEMTFPVGADGRLYFSVSIVVNAGAREATWQLPVEAVPHGVVTLQEGDDGYDRFLTMAAGKN